MRRRETDPNIIQEKSIHSRRTTTNMDMNIITGWAASSSAPGPGNESIIEECCSCVLREDPMWVYKSRIDR